MPRKQGYAISLKGFLVVDSKDPEKMMQAAKAVSEARKTGNLSALSGLIVLAFDQKFMSKDIDEPNSTPTLQATGDADSSQTNIETATGDANDGTKGDDLEPGTLDGAEIVGDDDDGDTPSRVDEFNPEDGDDYGETIEEAGDPAVSESTDDAPATTAGKRRGRGG